MDDRSVGRSLPCISSTLIVLLFQCTWYCLNSSCRCILHFANNFYFSLSCQQLGSLKWLSSDTAEAKFCRMDLSFLYSQSPWSSFFFLGVARAYFFSLYFWLVSIMVTCNVYFFCYYFQSRLKNLTPQVSLSFCRSFSLTRKDPHPFSFFPNFTDQMNKISLKRFWNLSCLYSNFLITVILWMFGLRWSTNRRTIVIITIIS